ncbi:choline dehydrogenase, mitochondrial-like [Folsomia candida]|uniref:choline dehydrogenase, mitochondrial-like n=1 Tax=Folsomia candida TaxID=158441 RepID=UPI001604EE88|nr:choline dehydrogenase, mitochondrial-like [Folsomia candida]
MRNGERESSYTAYLKGIESSRSSLLILRYCEVDMILINMGNVAYGVRYKRHGIPQIAHVTKEIIVSSGVISSPLLLMKSGIGPRTQLTKGGIPTKVDSIGVGQNLHNHGGVTLLFSVNNPKLELLPKVEKRAFEEDLGRYHDSIWRHGFFARVDFGPQAFIVSGRAKGEGEANHPDLQIIYRLKPLLGDGQLEIQLHVIITRMKSVGSVGFNSTSHFEGEEDDTKLAIIDDKLFTDSTDVDVLIEGIKLAIKIMEETTPFQAMKLSYNENPPELCKSLPPRSDEAHGGDMQNGKRAGPHGCFGFETEVPFFTSYTNKQRTTLLTAQKIYRVKGVKKLRVVDASALPRTPNSGIFAATLMLAEKTVQEIFKEHVSEMTPPAVIPQPQQLEPSL